MQVLTNDTQIKNDKHFSFQGPNGTSIPDYIMTPKGHIGQYEYSVANHLHFGSWHKPIIASFKFPEIVKETWGDQTHSLTEWDDDSIKTYNQKLKELLPNIQTTSELNTKQKIDIYSN